MNPHPSRPIVQRFSVQQLPTPYDSPFLAGVDFYDSGRAEAACCGRKPGTSSICGGQGWSQAAADKRSEREGL